jgi:hypothetical protein
MANTDTPWGLKPLFMTEARKTAMLLPITNNYGTDLFVNDPVMGVTAGTLERSTETGALLTIGSILGIYRQGTPKSIAIERLLPVQYYAATPGTTYNYFALVTTDPNMFFTMQEDGVTTPLSAAMCFSNCDFIFTHGGNTTTGISGAEIDSNTMATTATCAVRIIRPWLEYYDAAGKSFNAITATAGASWCKWIVRINNYQFGDNTLGLA